MNKPTCPHCQSTDTVFHDGALGYEAVRCNTCNVETDLHDPTSFCERTDRTNTRKETMKTKLSPDGRFELCETHPAKRRNPQSAVVCKHPGRCIKDHIYSIYFREKLAFRGTDLGFGQFFWLADFHSPTIANDVMATLEKDGLFKIMLAGEIRPMNEPHGHGNGWEDCEADEATMFAVFGETGPLQGFATMAEAEEFLRINEGKIQ